jgi:large subunit ribosomal protein L21
MYAILSHGGRQYRVSAGDRLVVDRLEAEVGSVIALEPILLTGGDGATGLGREIEGMRVAATVVAHTRGRKLRIFKYKAKKRYRKVAGHRSDLTELRVESILAKGAALPEAPAARAERTDSAAAEASADKAAAAPARAPRPRSEAAAADTATPAVTAATAQAQVEQSDEAAAATTPAATAKPRPAKRATKAAPKKSEGGSAAKDEETGDGS